MYQGSACSGRCASRASARHGVHDHLHDMPDRTLDQDDEIPRRRGRGNQAQLLDDRPRRARPLRALPVSQEPPRPQPTIDLRAKLGQITPLARRGQPHMPPHPYPAKPTRPRRAATAVTIAPAHVRQCESARLADDQTPSSSRPGISGGGQQPLATLAGVATGVVWLAMDGRPSFGTSPGAP
jgi:hypothetical protein